MELAQVTGTVTATMKDTGLGGLKLLLVERVDAVGAKIGPTEVATDGQGAGPGDLVLVVRGSAARQAAATRSLPTDLTIVAIVDNVDVARSSTNEAPAPPPTT
jgi:ethanolamine utilization protein EutN